jgi:hypothetical protein
MTYTQLANRFVQAKWHYKGRGGARITHIGIHHIGGTAFDAAVEAWRSGSESGSAHVTISNEGEIVALLQEEDGAWSLSNETADCFSLVMEIENQTGAPDWLISDAAYEAAARVSADWRRRYGPLTMWGHNQYAERKLSYPTWCPGPASRVERINARANQLLDDKENEMRLLANTVTNVWAVGGPGVWYTVPSAMAGKFQEVYGTRIACTDAEFLAFKAMCLSAKSSVDVAALNATIEAAIAAGFAAVEFPEPDALVFAKAVRAELAENPLR